MKSKRALFLLAIAAIFVLCSCSGPSTTCTTNCVVASNASLTVSLYDTAPAGANVLSFTLPIAGISLTPSSGSPQAVATVTSSVEVTRLQSDSAVIADQASVLTGSYTAINVTLGPTSATNNLFVNTSGSTITYGTNSCVNGAICALPVGAVYTITIPLTLNLSTNQSQWIGLDLNLSKAITSSGGISVDFSQAGVLTATTTTRTGLPSGSVDTLEDFTGVVTAYTAGSSITVQSAIRGEKLTASLTSSTEYDSAAAAYSQCSGTGSSCVAVGSTVSLDATVSSSGTFTATEVDVLDATAVDEVEGIIYPTSTAGEYGMILADKVSASGNAALNAGVYGSGALLTLNATDYSIDTKTLSAQLSQNAAGFTSSNDILGGQVVRAQVSGISTNSNGTITASATNMLLRYSRLSGTVNSVAGSIFTIASLPGYINAWNTSLSSTPQVFTYATLTAFDGITGLSDASAGSSVSIRALYLNTPAPYPFQAAKVRVP